MLLIQKKQKYKKQQKRKPLNKIAKVLSFFSLKFGVLGLKALEFGRVSSKQLLSLYLTLNKIIKKSGKVLLKVFPQTPITRKPLEIRMGKGKGSVYFWIAKIYAGTILCEVLTLNHVLGIKALLEAKQKLPLKTKII